MSLIMPQIVVLLIFRAILVANIALLVAIWTQFPITAYYVLQIVSHVQIQGAWVVNRVITYNQMEHAYHV